MSEEKSQWKIDSWSALQSAATLLMMAVAGLIWGLKLENRIDLVASHHMGDVDKMNNKIENLELITRKGILPVTEVRIHSIEVQIEDMMRDIDSCVGRKR